MKELQTFNFGLRPGLGNGTTETKATTENTHVVCPTPARTTFVFFFIVGKAALFLCFFNVDPYFYVEDGKASREKMARVHGWSNTSRDRTN